mmetsp:Transcript_3440/g.10023  ORF Transcript_3440/g.10023 Transcript_3440/m.10023 type:complete len:250 (-) Transcript_3440:152-901(-)
MDAAAIGCSSNDTKRSRHASPNADRIISSSCAAGITSAPARTRSNAACTSGGSTFSSCMESTWDSFSAAPRSRLRWSARRSVFFDVMKWEDMVAVAPSAGRSRPSRPSACPTPDHLLLIESNALPATSFAPNDANEKARCSAFDGTLATGSAARGATLGGTLGSSGFSSSVSRIRCISACGSPEGNTGNTGNTSPGTTEAADSSLATGGPAIGTTPARTSPVARAPTRRISCIILTTPRPSRRRSPANA